MKLNHDCIRSILLFIEETQTISQKGYPNRISDNVLFEHLSESYAVEELIYNTRKLYEGGYLDLLEIKATSGYSFDIMDITFIGHQYLANIKDESIWNQVKERLKLTSSTVSLSLISSLSSKIASIVIENL